MLGQMGGETPTRAVWSTAGANARDNVVDVTGMGPDERAAAAWLTERYGDRLRLTWRGSAEPRVAPVSWQVWEAPPARPRAVIVRWTSNSAYRFERVEVDEANDRIAVTVHEAIPAGFTTMAATYRSAEVHLDQPLGTRPVIDALSGRPRPRL